MTNFLRNNKYFHVEVFTQGKISQDLNEDLFVVTPNTLAVIDGATSKTPLKFKNLTGGQLASKLVLEALKDTGPSVNGKELVDFITNRFNQTFKEMGVTSIIERTPEVRPTAGFVAARIVDMRLIVTQVSDVSFRINGKKTYQVHEEIGSLVAKKRIEAIKKAKENHPNISVEELLTLGKESIKSIMQAQVIEYQNNPIHPLGIGVIDGRSVPEKFIHVYSFPLKDLKTLEIFTDGYFKQAKEPNINSWEEAFKEVEKKDPLKIGTYPSNKGSTSKSFTDDRTVLIAKFNN